MGAPPRGAPWVPSPHAPALDPRRRTSGLGHLSRYWETCIFSPSSTLLLPMRRLISCAEVLQRLRDGQRPDLSPQQRGTLSFPCPFTIAENRPVLTLLPVVHSFFCVLTALPVGGVSRTALHYRRHTHAHFNRLDRGPTDRHPEPDFGSISTMATRARRAS
jgi:hypothetical protein